MKYFEISVLTANSRYLQKAALKIRRRPDDNENVKKSNRFNNQNNFARASRFLYISLPSLHDYDVKMPIFAFYSGSTQATKFPLSF